MRKFIAAALALSLSACATSNDKPPRLSPTDWRSRITLDDRERLREWRTSFASALAGARSAGKEGAIRGQGRLLMPDAATGGAIPNGDYRCRIVKLGARSPGLLDYIEYPAFACRIGQQGPVQSFAKLSGSQRQVGTIYPADAMRSVLLGTLVLGDETRPMRYAIDPDRDVAGWVERIEPNRWRIIFPRPRFESLTDVMELVPAG